MAATATAFAPDIAAHLAAEERKTLLRFIACGSVDDGKSSLIGRLLHDSQRIYDDQLAALAADSKRIGTRGGEIDFALLLDGLAAEREQGITIDVAYRYFSTARRKYIVADTPGHEQYTRNMATGASTADLAVILVDARKGVLTQTRRHSHLVALLGVRHVVLAVNKMDLVGWDERVFRDIEAAYGEFAQRIGLDAAVAIPVCAVDGDNVVAGSAAMPWYAGPTLLDHLDRVEVATGPERPFRLPVQWVNRPDQGFRGYAGTIASGAVRPGDRVRIAPSGRESSVARIVTADGDLGVAGPDQAVTLTLADELDVSRGDVIAAATDPVGIADQFEATVVWMAEAPMLRGRSYLMKLGTRTVTATIAPLKYRIDVDTLHHQPAEALRLNEIGVCEIELDRAIPWEPYTVSRDLGGFILVDRMTNGTVGAGMLRFALRRSQNLHWQAVDVHRAARAALLRQQPCVLWFTGLSGAGKSTIANLVEKQLFARGCHTYLLDGDNVRHGLNKDLGFSAADRVENIRRIAEVAALMADAGLIVLTAFISPFRAERAMARALLPPGEFIEIFVDTPLEVAETRDAKGLYRKARRGELANFTGIDSPYELPDAPEITIANATGDPVDAAQRIVDLLAQRGFLP